LPDDVTPALDDAKGDETMSKWKRTVLIVALLLVGLLFFSHAQAMFSTNFRLDWFTPMTAGGGGPTSSAHYAANFTVGQTVIGTSASQHYGSRLGYWYGFLTSFLHNFHDFLPLVMK
jgi:hypothetical protein